jgi:hypothetical protein
MQLFLHSKKNLNMFTKKPFYLLVSMLFIFSAGNAQSVIFNLTNNQKIPYLISELRNITYGANTITILRTNGTPVTYNRTDVTSYKYDAAAPVTDINTINDAAFRVYPNPFKESVRISYELTATEQVSIEILDIAGRSIKIWPTEKKKPGTYEVIWQVGDNKGSTIQPGTYICRIKTSKGTLSKMMVME